MGAYICATLELDGGEIGARVRNGLQRFRKALCSISGIVPLSFTITWLGAL